MSLERSVPGREPRIAGGTASKRDQSFGAAPELLVAVEQPVAVGVGVERIGTALDLLAVGELVVIGVVGERVRAELQLDVAREPILIVVLAEVLGRNAQVGDRG